MPIFLLSNDADDELKRSLHASLYTSQMLIEISQLLLTF
jgi:hypothetical protein